MEYEDAVLDKLSRAERISMFEESDMGKEFKKYLEDKKNAAVKLMVKTPAENKDQIMELQILYKVCDDFWNVINRIRDEGEMAFHEAKELGILPGADQKKQ